MYKNITTPVSEIKKLSEIAADVGSFVKPGIRTVFVSGNFNVIHPGHLRFLNFAASIGDFLIVGVTREGSSGAFVPESLRLEGVRNLSLVNYSFLMPVSPAECIEGLRPNFVVKGKEFTNQYNAEKKVLDTYGGKLCFSSGEVRFSSMDLLQKELSEINRATIQKPVDFLLRHNTDINRLIEITKSFDRLKVAVIGDLIVDEYITCQPLGMSQEDPTIVVSPLRKDIFIGGAGVVAAHASRLGAKVIYYGVVGKDSIGTFAKKALEDHGVDAKLFEDNSRVTTLKQRYRSNGKTLLRVSHLDQHEISNELADEILNKINKDIDDIDLLVFSDFNYGCLPQNLVDKIISACHNLGVFVSADSQSSSQIGDISRYSEVILVTPTEYEARLAIRDKDLGLAALAQALREKSKIKNVFITLAGEGVLIDSDNTIDGEMQTDQLPAFNLSPKDVAGAGDSLLITASMALGVGATGWEAAYLGSVAAACQVGRVGNFPLTAEELIQELLY